MSEVKKWYIGVYGGEAQARTCSPHAHEVIRDTEGDTFVLSRDYNAAQAKVSALQQRLTAADELVNRLEAENTAMRKDTDRYQWLRGRDLNSVHLGGVFAGRTPQNIVLNGEDLDQAIDAALKPAEGGGDD